LLITADNALKSAAEFRNRRTNKEVDSKFREVIYMLSGFDSFEKVFPSKDPMLDPDSGETITREVNIGDGSKSPSVILHTLKRNLHAKVKYSTGFFYPSTLTNLSQRAINGQN
jgi:hypothetical protein